MSIYSVNQKNLESPSDTNSSYGGSVLKSGAGIAEEFLAALNQNGVNVNGAILTVNSGLSTHVGNASQTKPEAKPTPKPEIQPDRDPAPRPDAWSKPEQQNKPEYDRPITNNKPSSDDKLVKPAIDKPSADQGAVSNKPVDKPSTDQGAVATDEAVADQGHQEPENLDAVALPQPMTQASANETTSLGVLDQAKEKNLDATSDQNQSGEKDTKDKSSLLQSPTDNGDNVEGDGIILSSNPEGDIGDSLGQDEVSVKSPSVNGNTTTDTTKGGFNIPEDLIQKNKTASDMPVESEIVTPELIKVVEKEIAEKSGVEKEIVSPVRLATPSAPVATPVGTEAAPVTDVVSEADVPVVPVVSKGNHDMTAKNTTDLAAQQSANLARQLEETGAQVKIKVQVTNADGEPVPVVPAAKSEGQSPLSATNGNTSLRPVTGDAPLSMAQPQNQQNQQQSQNSNQGQQNLNQNVAGFVGQQSGDLSGVKDPRHIQAEGQKFIPQTKTAETAPQFQSLSRSSSGTQASNSLGLSSFSSQFGDVAGRNSATPLAHVPRSTAQLQKQVMEQLNVNIQKQVSEGKDLIKVQLRPAELGRIEIRLEVTSDSKVVAQVIADNRDTLSLLQKDQSSLEKALRDAGLDVDSNAMSFNWRGDQQQAGENGQQGRHRGGRRIKTGTDATTEAVIAQQEAARAARNRSGVDIQV